MASVDGLQYGDLAALHPSETHAQLKTRRESNYSILKQRLQSGSVALGSKRLEISIPSGQTIQASSLNLSGVSSAATQIVVWPFVPVGDSSTKDVLITPRYGDVHNISNITIKSPVKNIKFETYDCTIRYGGTANAIKITSSVRSGFFSSIAANDKIWFSWSLSVLGQTKLVKSVDAVNSIIYTTTSITGVSDNTTGKFGKTFPEDISISDYESYGDQWYIDNTGIALIYGVPAATSGEDYVLNMTNVVMENTSTQVSVSMGTAKMNFDTVTFNGSGVALSFFVRGYAGGQKVTINNSLTMSDNGYRIVGGITTIDATGIFGAGGYLHDSVIVQCNGTLNLINNTAAAWRQYSSGYNPANAGTNYYANIHESGGGEYAILTSNVTATTIDNIVCEKGVWLRHNTVINGGDIGAEILAYSLNFGTGSITGQFNDVTFRGTVNLAIFASAELNDCNYYLPLLSDAQVIITPVTSGPTTINGGTIFKTSGVGTWNPSTGVATGVRGSNFILNSGLEINIDGLSFNEYPYVYFFDDSVPQSPFIEKDYTRNIDNIDLKCYAFWLDAQSNTAGTVSNIFNGVNTIVRNSFTGNGAGKYFVQNISGTTGTVAKSIVSSKSYGTIGTLTNVLEIDFEHDYYQTSGSISAIVATNSWNGSYSSNPIYGKNIRLYAVGGDITLSTFDTSLRPTSNIVGANGTTITNGNYLDLTIDRDYVLQTGSTQNAQVIATGNGVTKIYDGVLTNWILDPLVSINVTAGAVNINSSTGVFNDASLVGFVDFFTGKYELRFTNNVGNGTPIVVTYNYPNVWKNTGAFILP